MYCMIQCNIQNNFAQQPYVRSQSAKRVHPMCSCYRKIKGQEFWALFKIGNPFKIHC